MAQFSAQFLDDLRARLPVSEVVGRAHKLKKQGAEFVAIDDQSLTCNDGKRVWFDFGKLNDGGDIFDWFVKIEGRQFPDAVEECAKLAGVAMPNGAHRNGAAHETRASNEAGKTDKAPDEGKREIEATYDYRDADGSLVMEVVRYLFRLPDGSYEKTKDGKRKKLHLQRRPDVNGGWIWKMDGVRLVPYRLPELENAITDDRPVYIVEGEKKADALAKIGLAASCNPAGAGKWPAHFAQYFAGARVIILPDNDDPGRKHADQVGENLDTVATSVMVLDLPDLPLKGDVVDWLAEGGTAAELAELAATARVWEAQVDAAAPFQSKFGGRRWEEMGRTSEPYPWTVENIIPQGESVLIYGESGSGKSFNGMDIAMCIARAQKFNGYNVEPGLVVYVAAEAGKGFEKRKIAYCTHHGLRLGDPLPFYLLTKRPDLFSSEADTDALIAEIEGIRSTYSEPLRAIFLDTVSALTPGMDENTSRDVSKVRSRIDRIKDAFKVSTLPIHHTAKGGTTPRGHGSFTNDFETTIYFQTVENTYDENGRALHRATLVKQREGGRGLSWEFYLPVVEIGKNKWGNPETSCVVRPVAKGAQTRSTAPVTPQQRRLMEALIKALDSHGITPAAAGLNLPRSIAKVVDYRHVKVIFARAELNDGDDPRDHSVRLRQALSRSRKELAARQFIGADDPYIWATGRPIDGVTAPVTPVTGGSDPRPDPGQDPELEQIVGNS